VFFPQGIYRTDETIHVPPGSRLVGEVFSVITGAGTHFSNSANPQPIVRLGNPGDRGVAQLTDLLISVSSVLPGAILLQVNMAGPTPGSVGLWNCILRVGGSVDTLVTTQCAAPADPASCKAAFALLHLTSSAANVYLEDFWGWVADHVLDHTNTTNANAHRITQRDHHHNHHHNLDTDNDSDDDTNNSFPPPAPSPSPQPRPALPSSVGQNIAVGRGALIESTSPAWFVGTSFEHCVLYQYALHGAANVYLGQHQTESPYWQGADAPVQAHAPEPWEVEGRCGDPGFGGWDGAEGDDGDGEGGMCRRAWGLYVSGVEDVVVHGSAMWSFYGGMADGNWGDPQCTRTGGICQENMAFVERARGMWWFSASSRAAKNLVVDGGGDGAESGADVVVTSQKEYSGGWGAVVGAYLRNSAGGDGGNVVGEEEGEDSRGGKVMVSGLGLAVTAAGMMCSRLIW
jgi:glucan 1,3-beta-glucosidase